MKRNPKDPEGQYIIQDSRMYSEDFCAEEGFGVSITGEYQKKTTITDLVIQDLRERERVGFKKYGKPLLPHDGRDSLRDLYEELLDAAQYIKKAMEEAQYIKKAMEERDK